jgi:hypothetical protein
MSTGLVSVSGTCCPVWKAKWSPRLGDWSAIFLLEHSHSTKVEVIYQAYQCGLGGLELLRGMCQQSDLGRSWPAVWDRSRSEAWCLPLETLSCFMRKDLGLKLRLSPVSRHSLLSTHKPKHGMGSSCKYSSCTRIYVPEQSVSLLQDFPGFCPFSTCLILVFFCLFYLLTLCQNCLYFLWPLNFLWFFNAPLWG